MIKLLNVSYSYPSNGAGVENLTFEVNQGDFILLVGRTGAGKTTMFKLISRELKPDSGEIFLDKLRSSQLKRCDIPTWRSCLGIVFQELRLLSDRSAMDNVRIAAVCERNLPGKPKARAFRAMAKVGLSHKLRDHPDHMSLGEQQRVAIARGLVNEPFVLLADEPVSNLDSGTSAEVIEVLQKINHSGTAVMVATHQPERFVSCNPRFIRLEKGRITEA